MALELYIISKLSSEVINISEVGISVLVGRKEIEEIYYEIYKLRKGLETEDYQLYWRYSMDNFFAIKDYMSFNTAITLAGERKIYMLMNDYGEIWEDNISFLEDLDAQELAEKRERERNIYDVRIPGKEDSVSIVNERRSFLDVEQFPREPRTNFDILKYSLRNIPEPKFLQNDLRSKSNFIEDVKMGYPKKKKIEPVTAEIIFRVVASKSKEKKASSKKSIKSKSSVKKKSSKGNK